MFGGPCLPSCLRDWYWKPTGSFVHGWDMLIGDLAIGEETVGQLLY